MGRALGRILDLNSTSFLSPQERFKRRDMKIMLRIMHLITEHNPQYLIFWYEWIEVPLLSTNILGKQINFFCHPSLMNFIIFTFNIDPGFGS